MRHPKLTSKQLVRVYLSFCSIYGRNITDGSVEEFKQLTTEIVENWVERGFDSDELIALGSIKSIEFLTFVANTAPQLDNSLF